MKKRVKVDHIYLIITFIVTGLLYQFPSLYSSNRTLDNVLDFLGFMVLVKGVCLRMAARGHKKKFSQKGEGLVTSGIYSYIRNPMYLGSFYIGFGYLLISWPWWTLPIYSLAFYWRFVKQVTKEEGHLRLLFGTSYVSYCQQVPRILPNIRDTFQIKMRDTFPLQEIWSTKEKRLLLIVPSVGFILEIFQEYFVYGSMHFLENLGIVALAMGVITILFWLRYQKV